MFLPWKCYLQQRMELGCNLLQKMESTRGYMPEKFPRGLQPLEFSGNLDGKLSDLGHGKLDMFPNSRTILRHDYNLRKSKKDTFKLFLNVPQFIPEEIDVKVVGDFIIVHGEHDEWSEEHSWVSRKFTRRFKIPADIDSFTLKPVLNNGVLVITASKEDTEPAAAGEWVVPIEIA